MPLFFGGNSPGSEERALEYGDGWAPLALAGIPDRIRAVKTEGKLRVVAVGVPANRAAAEEYAAAGADRIVFRLASAARGEIERLLDEVQSAAAALA